ncbi:MAG: hypothetical protein LBQ04_02205 [Endomicrobium sp.]|jgi:hypothetical protein|nr:hypothetical protein [Endomicrobium sp.]
MDGIKFFVPAIKSGKVSTEQFKMQLRMNKAVNKGIIRTRKRIEQIDPEFASYSLLKAESVVEEVKSITQYFPVSVPTHTPKKTEPIVEEK